MTHTLPKVEKQSVSHYRQKYFSLRVTSNNISKKKKKESIQRKLNEARDRRAKLSRKEGRRKRRTDVEEKRGAQNEAGERERATVK